MNQNPATRLKAIEKDITAAAAEVTIRQRQLQELKPQRREIETECQKQFGCEIGDLKNYIADKTQQMEQLVTELEADLKIAKGEQEEEDA
jgi:hypothetical protein